MKKGEGRQVQGRQYVLVAVSVAAVIAVCAFIFIMSDTPADDSDAMSLGLAWHIVSFIVPGYDQLPAAEQLHWQETLNHPVRKAAHFLEYAALGALMLNMLVQIARLRRGESGPARQVLPSADGGPAGQVPPSADGGPAPSREAGIKFGRLVAAAWALGTLYAASDEVHQLFIEGRTGQLSDVLLDSSGVLAGALLCWLLLRRLLRV